MAEFNGSNYSKIFIDVPSKQISEGELSGKVRVLQDSFICGQNVYAIGDLINMGAKLPKGAKVIEACLISPSLGTTGIMKLGFLANGIDSADDDAFIASSDAGGQAVKSLMPAGSAALGKKFEADTSIQIKFTEASDAALGLEIKVFIQYILE
jgi:hypothetical protein